MAWLPLVTTIAAADAAISVADVKAQARITSSSEDDLLGAYISAATRMIEKYTGLRLAAQTVLLQASQFADLASLPVAPVTSISSVKYLDSAGALQTVSTDVYEVVITGLDAVIRLKVGQSWPSPRIASNAVQVTAVVGACEDDVKHALALTVATWFQQREMGGLSSGALSLLENNRVAVV